MGMRASPTGELIFADCLVPLENRVGEEGASVKQMMRNLDIERITISGISLGLARAALEVATSYATERKQFGKPIGAFQQVQERLAEGSAWYEGCRSLTYTAAKVWDLGLLTGKPAAAMAARASCKRADGDAGHAGRGPDTGRLRIDSRIPRRAVHARREAHRNRRRH